MVNGSPVILYGSWYGVSANCPYILNRKADVTDLFPMSGQQDPDGADSSVGLKMAPPVSAFIPPGATFQIPFACSPPTEVTMGGHPELVSMAEKRDEIRRMMEVAAADIKQLGGSVELVDIGTQKVGQDGGFPWEAPRSCWASGPRRWAAGRPGLSWAAPWSQGIRT